MILLPVICGNRRSQGAHRLVRIAPRRHQHNIRGNRNRSNASLFLQQALPRIDSFICASTIHAENAKERETGCSTPFVRRCLHSSAITLLASWLGASIPYLSGIPTNDCCLLPNAAWPLAAAKCFLCFVDAGDKAHDQPTTTVNQMTPLVIPTPHCCSSSPLVKLYK